LKHFQKNNHHITVPIHLLFKANKNFGKFGCIPWFKHQKQLAVFTQNQQKRH